VTASGDTGNVRYLRRRRFGWLREWPIALVLLGVVVALGFVAADRFRVGSVLLALSVVLAFLLRLLLPTRRVGLLAVRSRTVDLTVLGVIGGLLLLMAIIVPPPT
jgi:hypothetical protein